MRTSRSILIYTILNVICCIGFIFMLPNDVVFGINGNLQASQYVSRWYNLIIPIAQVISAFVIYFMDVFAPKYHKYRYLISWVAIAFTTYFMWVLMLVQYSNFALGETLNWPWIVVVMFPIDLFLLAEGFYTVNKDFKDFSIFGFWWVKASSLVWKETHRVAGLTLIVVAFAQMVLSVINVVLWNVWWMYFVLLGIWVVIHWLYTFICAINLGKKYGTR